MARYAQVISLGFFCSVASELQRCGLRQQSYPFDWILSSLPGALRLLENNFSHFLNEELLGEPILAPGEAHLHIQNTFYDIWFFHDFMPGDIALQLPSIQSKYERRIARLYNQIQNRTLFVRYIRDEAELTYAEENIQYIKRVIKKYNPDNEILFIAHKEYKISHLETFRVSPDNNDSVARTFMEKNNDLLRLMLQNIVPQSSRDTHYFYKPSVRAALYRWTCKGVVSVKRFLNAHLLHK